MQEIWSACVAAWNESVHMLLGAVLVEEQKCKPAGAASRTRLQEQ
jgi:hypothetical protein